MKRKSLLEKDSVKSLIASLVSILVGLFGITVFSRGITYSVGLTGSEIVADVNNSDLTFNRVFNVLSGQSNEDLFSAAKGIENNFISFGNAIQERLGTGVNRLSQNYQKTVRFSQKPHCFLFFREKNFRLFMKRS